MARELIFTFGVQAKRFFRYFAPRALTYGVAAIGAVLLSSYIVSALMMEVAGLAAPSFSTTALAQSSRSERERRRAERERERAQKERERAERERERERERAERERERAENERERERERAEKERERAQKEREQQREKAEKERERERKRAEAERERISKERERERERAEQERERQARSDPTDQESRAGRATRPQARDEDQRDSATERSDDLDERDANFDREEGQEQKDDEDRRKTRYLEDLEDRYPPATVLEMIQRWTKSEPKAKREIKRALKRRAKRKRKKNRSRRTDIRLALPPSPNATYKLDEVLASNLSKRSLKLARRLGFRVKNVRRFSTLNGTVSKLIPPAGLDARSARNLLRRKLPKGKLSLNRYYRIYRIARGGTQSRPKPSLRKQLPWRSRCDGDQCYGLSMIDWRPSLNSCTTSVKVGVIDTPVDHRHPTFSGKDIHVGTFVTGAREKSADWHGTGILALLTGDPKTTTPGLIPGASFYVADVFTRDAAGSPVAESLSLLKAFDWMEAFGVNIINLSLAGPKDPLVEQAIARLSKKGIIFVAAAGNNGPTAPPNYPAAYKQVIAVTAVNQKLRNYRHANRGSFIDVAAPGVRIWTAAPGKAEGYRSGTSFAVPFVTAVAAAHYRQLTKPSKTSLLSAVATKDLGPRGRDKIYGRGLILAPASCGGRQPWQTAPAVVAKQSR